MSCMREGGHDLLLIRVMIYRAAGECVCGTCGSLHDSPAPQTDEASHVLLLGRAGCYAGVLVGIAGLRCHHDGSGM